MDVAYIFWTEPQAIVVPRPGEEPAVFLLSFGHSNYQYDKSIECLIFIIKILS